MKSFLLTSLFPIACFALTSCGEAETPQSENAPSSESSATAVKVETQKLSAEDIRKESSKLWKKYHDHYRKSDDYKTIGALPSPFPTKPDKNFRLSPRTIESGSFKMPYVVLNKAPKSNEKSPLYICMHGGGGNNKVKGPHAWPVNDREWSTQAQLAAVRYPKHGVFFVPRMADDRTGRWRHDHNVDIFDRIIRHAILEWNVDPDRVYMLGISQGGYGTDKMLPYMADRFAAGNSMAAGSLVKVGKFTTCENLRNTPMRTDIGEKDTMFNRLGLAKELHQRLEEFGQAEPKTYKHHLNIHPGKGHGGWDYGVGPAWLGQFSRNPYPNTLIWVTTPPHKTLRSTFYWLSLAGDERTKNARIEAKIDKQQQTVYITTTSFDKEGNTAGLDKCTLSLHLNDKIIDLDKPVKVVLNGESVHSGIAQRSVDSLKATIKAQGDPNYVFPVTLEFELK